MKKYLLSKIAAIFFGITTLILVHLASAGQLYELVGSVELGVTIYLVNTAFLLASFLVYIWQKSYKNLPSHRESEIIEAWAADLAEQDSINQPRHFLVDEEELLAVAKSYDIVSIRFRKEFSSAKAGEIIRLYASTSPKDNREAKIVSIDADSVQLILCR